MTDRRPLGIGPATADASRTQDTDPPAPRAPLAAERLPTDPADPAATGPAPRPAAGRGTGPVAPPGRRAPHPRGRPRRTRAVTARPGQAPDGAGPAGSAPTGRASRGAGTTPSAAGHSPLPAAALRPVCLAVCTGENGCPECAAGDRPSTYSDADVVVMFADHYGTLAEADR
ncbi:hypothetical protein ACFY8B_33005 [Streptomyces sp. NPDC012751]|uniref:hypothetical protein n=1 Tax=Streptomyces sp. NPDC012751 TaxID=3364846 RepID=UPI00369C405A